MPEGGQQWWSTFQRWSIFILYSNIINQIKWLGEKIGVQMPYRRRAGHFGHFHLVRDYLLKLQDLLKASLFKAIPNSIGQFLGTGTSQFFSTKSQPWRNVLYVKYISLWAFKCHSLCVSQVVVEILQYCCHSTAAMVSSLVTINSNWDQFSTWKQAQLLIWFQHPKCC